MAAQKEYKVGILGATGTVGQRFIVLLQNHPYMKIHTLGASSRSAGKTYKEATRWTQAIQMPTFVKGMQIYECKSEHFKECDVVFSGLDHDVAGPIEIDMLKANIPVFSNAKNYRRDETCPLIVPTVNTSHFDLIPHQRSLHGLDKGFLVTNANCSTTGIVVPLKALQDAFGELAQINIVTMQAISGAGYPGVPSLDIIDNLVPFIGGEEDKIEWETNKILGGLSADNKSFDYLKNTKVAAQCNRVAVIDGHTECVQVTFAQRPAPSIEEVKKVLREYTCEAQSLNCPSAPKHAIHVFEENDRPQPRLDRDVDGGYAVAVGRVREDKVFDIKFVALSHNTVIGAAGSGILNAEVAIAKGLF
ncbi:aspartate-semialdehyde dehydrogenase [Saitoella coloradoensis]